MVSLSSNAVSWIVNRGWPHVTAIPLGSAQTVKSHLVQESWIQRWVQLPTRVWKCSNTRKADTHNGFMCVWLLSFYAGGLCATVNRWKGGGGGWLDGWIPVCMKYNYDQIMFFSCDFDVNSSGMLRSGKHGSIPVFMSHFAAISFKMNFCLFLKIEHCLSLSL